MDKYSVIIPTLWQSKRIHTLLRDLIESDSVGDIILIDNNREYDNHYSEPLPRVQLVQPDQNIYVNPAWNLGVGLSKFDCIALANDDINFNTKIFRALNSEMLLKYGFIGMGAENYKMESEQLDLNLEIWDHEVSDWGWGCLIFFHKSDWINIPDALKIWYGDNFIKELNPAPKATLRNFKVDTEMSTTSDQKDWDEVKQLDEKHYTRIKWLCINYLLGSVSLPGSPDKP